MSSSEVGVTELHSPSCDAEALLANHIEYKVENFGSMLLNTTVCQSCGYRNTDVLTLTSREPVYLKASINSIEDLDVKVIKSSTATIQIPELNATLTPGPYSEGYVTNVEGILERIEDALTFMRSSIEDERLERGKKILKQIRLAREGKSKFALVIKDPPGNSALVSTDQSKILRRRLRKKELSRVKFGQYAQIH